MKLKAIKDLPPELLGQPLFLGDLEKVDQTISGLTLVDADNNMVLKFLITSYTVSMAIPAPPEMEDGYLLTATATDTKLA